ncbi:MAG: 2-C-methyl-D-erythritol 4-phosphate cytidylyltransferase [Desulfobacterales bacterium]|jgi:2-C-methyl-D-erythritol 4-phosphate cytidylyltransferase|nr:2-C-methyl-D-erythritol 4-phosphate cytidylyltransferase [Desulfobacterales bacterium]
MSSDPAGPDRVYALIVAGGKGARFSRGLPKQYVALAGVPILIRTLRAFDECDVIDRLIVAVPPEDIAFVRDTIIGPAGLCKSVSVIAGGPRRQDSVFNGLATIPLEASLVVIHDAVRPLVTGEVITACVDAARRYGACIAALPVWDTLKRISDSGCIEATLPRERVWMAQTPQVFRLDLIRAAHERAHREEVPVTDDASMVERMGAAVHVVPGSQRNIKITTLEDLDLAAALLGAPEASSGNQRNPVAADD